MSRVLAEEMVDRSQNHAYGERVRLLDDAWTRTALARLSAPETETIEMLALLRSVYQRMLFSALEDALPTREVELRSRLVEKQVDLEEGARALQDMDKQSPLGITVINKFKRSSRL